MSPSRFGRPRALVSLIAGYLVWSSCFVALYGLLSVGCTLQLQLRAGPFGTNGLTLLLAAVWLLHLAVLAWLIRSALRRRTGGEAPAFLRRITLLLHLSALAATLWIGLPLLLLPPCS